MWTKLFKRKSEGKAEVILSVFLLLFILPVLAASMQTSQFRATKTYVEDALAASNLASAVIDIEAYGVDNSLIIGDPDTSYAIYKDALKINLNLDDNWESSNKAAITGKVEIYDYIIYNVRDNDIEVYKFDGQGNMDYSFIPEGMGSISAPEGSLIESTSVYSRIGFPVEGIFDIKVDAVKEKLVDIVKN